MIRLIWCTLIGLLIGLQSLSARERPRWELGIIHAAGQLPHYTGSNHYYQQSINLPYGILRSEQIDVSGVPGCSQILHRICVWKWRLEQSCRWSPMT